MINYSKFIRRGAILKDLETIGIVGAGLMGHALAQMFALKGYAVNLFDRDQEILAQVRERVTSNLKVFIDLGLVNEHEAETCFDNITLCRDMEDIYNGEDCIIIEAVSENLDTKKSIFAKLEKIAPPETILTSNTSAISITEISRELKFRERVVGTHFWNPPHIIPCVEVIRSEFTSDETFQTVLALLKKVGKEPVGVLKDVPGFLGNRMQHALWREAISLVEKGIATAEDIDRVVKFSFGLRLAFIGPLETADIAGLDLTLDVEKDLFPEIENSTNPSKLLTEMVKRKQTGVRKGKGFYEWSQEKIDAKISQRDRILLKILKEVF
jgi:3-hydroxybutyryl-CoA dehydrogenase